MKSPEEYFIDRDFPVEPQTETLSDSEKAFVEKFLGVSAENGQGDLVLPRPVQAESVTSFAAQPQEQEHSAGAEKSAGVPTAPEKCDENLEQAAPAETVDADDFEEKLKEESSLQLVAFTLNGQEYTVPIEAVQEVIKYVTPTKLPSAPAYVAGIVNLRGHVTPLITTGSLLGGGEDGDGCRFIMVCRRKGLQLGLLIETVKTMYRVEQNRIDWHVESHLGSDAEYVMGLLKADDQRLVGILSVDRIVQHVLMA